MATRFIENYASQMAQVSNKPIPEPGSPESTVAAPLTPSDRRKQSLPPEIKQAAFASPPKAAEIINRYYNYGELVPQVRNA